MTDAATDILDLLRQCDANHAALDTAKPGDAFVLYGRVYTVTATEMVGVTKRIKVKSGRSKTSIWLAPHSRADVMVGTMPHCWTRYGCPADIAPVAR
jgi:hypothetical protein